MRLEACTCDPPSDSVLPCHPPKCGQCRKFLDADYVGWLNAKESETIALHPDATFQRRILEGWTIQEAAASQVLTDRVIEFMRGMPRYLGVTLVSP